jgi:hypothetical protein
LLRDGAQHVAGTRNVGKIDLGLDLVFDVSGRRAGRLCRR